jgi:hypothetical protein
LSSICLIGKERAEGITRRRGEGEREERRGDNDQKERQWEAGGWGERRG